MRQYPIWNIITACIYKSGKSYGVKDTGEVEVRIGTSSSNSHTFLKHTTTHRQLENGDREYRFYIDGVSGTRRGNPPFFCPQESDSIRYETGKRNGDKTKGYPPYCILGLRQV
jgi:hypothetical protein